MANRDPLLNFEQFVRRKNSFHMHFVGMKNGHILGDIYRKTYAYQRCLKEKPEFKKIAEQLASYYEAGKPVLGETPERQKLLYDAYQLMHPFAQSNEDLFR